MGQVWSTNITGGKKTESCNAHGQIDLVSIKCGTYFKANGRQCDLNCDGALLEKKLKENGQFKCYDKSKVAKGARIICTSFKGKADQRNGEDSDAG